MLAKFGGEEPTLADLAVVPAEQRAGFLSIGEKITIAEGEVTVNFAHTTLLAQLQLPYPSLF